MVASRPGCGHVGRNHRGGRCCLELAENVDFLALQDGIPPTSKSVIGYPAPYRRQLAQRFGMHPEALDRALYRARRTVAS